MAALELVLPRMRVTTGVANEMGRGKSSESAEGKKFT